MMMNLCCDVIASLNGRTLVTAESCTGGGIGAAITAIPGSSKVYKGGIISYTNEIKHDLLNISYDLLNKVGAVSAEVAEMMAVGARTALSADIAVSVTGLAGPDGDDFANPVGTVFVGYSDLSKTVSERHLFLGDRDSVRTQAINAALRLVLKNII